MCVKKKRENFLSRCFLKKMNKINESEGNEPWNVGGKGCDGEKREEAQCDHYAWGERCEAMVSMIRVVETSGTRGRAITCPP